MNRDEVLDDEVENEYEYDPVETETFYVDLDLTTANGGKREPLKRRKLGLQSAKDGEDVSDSEQTPKASADLVIASVQADDEAIIENEAAPEDPNDAQGHSATTSRANDIQILGLHGQNPVISYQNQIYYCTWSDMIGTAMFFSKSEAGTEEEALMSTNDFRLVNTSRIKLIGQKAKLAGKPGRKRPRQAEGDSMDALLSDGVDDDGIAMMSGKSLGEIRTSNSKVNADIKRQAAFLEKLMDVKRAKGETDNVRTVFSQRKGGTKIIQPRKAETGGPRPRQVFPSIAKEIEELNRRVVRGDATALMRLQDIYSSMEDDIPSLRSQQQLPAAAGQNPDEGSPTANVSAQRQALNE